MMGELIDWWRHLSWIEALVVVAVVCWLLEIRLGSVIAAGLALLLLMKFGIV